MCHRKMKIAHANFLHSVERYVSTNPEVAAYVSDFVARGLDAARKEAMYRAADMETALSVAIAKRYNGREELILQKLQKWNGASALRWDDTIAMLEGKKSSTGVLGASDEPTE